MSTVSQRTLGESLRKKHVARIRELDELRGSEHRYVRARLNCAIAHVRKLAVDAEITLRWPKKFLVPRAHLIGPAAIVAAREVIRLRRLEKELRA